MAVGILAGLLCGVLTGLGVGGGSLLMVWLTAVLGMEQRAAQGVNLLYFLPTSLSSAFVHMRRKLVDFDIALPAAAAGALSACAGAFLTQRMDVGLLRKLFGVLLMTVGAMEVYKALKKQKPPPP